MATYRLFGPSGGSAATVTERLGIAPTWSVEAGDPAGRRSPGRIHPHSAWHLASADTAEDGVELAECLHTVLRQLEPVARAVWELVYEGYEASWFCYVGSFALEHAVELDREILTRVLALPGELLLDVYDEESDE